MSQVLVVGGFGGRTPCEPAQVLPSPMLRLVCKVRQPLYCKKLRTQDSMWTMEFTLLVYMLSGNNLRRSKH